MARKSHRLDEATETLMCPATSHELESNGARSLPKRGTIFDRKYRIDGLLGVGGMGAVLAATHLGLDEPVAIKMLLPEAKDDAGLVQRFLQEGRASSRIRSEHVVRVMDVAVCDGRPYLVLEYLVGRDLGALLEEDGPLSIEDAVDYVLQACEALAEAHAWGVIHRDLKPANLFLTHRADGSPCVKVLDFGISKVLRGSERSSPHGPSTLANEVIGSPHYMPPEQLEGAANVDARSDIWSIGAIVHELLAGQPPFQAENMTALCASILRDPAPPLSNERRDVPPALVSIVLRCLEKEPSNRFANLAELARALAVFGTAGARASALTIAKVVEGGGFESPASEPISPRRITPSGGAFARPIGVSQSPGGRPRRFGHVLAAGLLLVTGAGVGWGAVRYREALPRAGAAVAAAAIEAPRQGPAPVQASRVPLASAASPSLGPAFDAGSPRVAAVATATRPRAVVPRAARAEAAARGSASPATAPIAEELEALGAGRAEVADRPIDSPTAAPTPPVSAEQLFDERK